VKKKKKAAWFIRLRLISQTFFVLLFLGLFLRTDFHAGSVPVRGVDVFFDLDPLALLSVWISGHKVTAAMLLALIWVAVTIVFGRWFCGWFCPFGALHNLVGSWRGGKVKAKIAEGGFSRWQHAKYLGLLAVLVSSLVGANLAGWFDPFSYLFRSLTLAVFPAVDAGLERLFAWLYRHDAVVGSLHLTTLTEPIYRWLHYHLLTVSPPRYFWSMMFGALFVVIIVLNLFRLRFWCKYICPLGALLGVFGKNPLLRLKVDPARCTDCGICVTECQGAASPNHEGSDWKPSECMYCLNCQASCTTHAIRFRVAVPLVTIGTAGKPAPVAVVAGVHDRSEQE
jgi:polyferredoxin